MSWYKVDDKLTSHRKFLRLGRTYGTEIRCLAMGLWVQAGSWSALNETNGFIPEDITEEFAPVTASSRVTDSDAVDVREALCDVGFWSRTDDGYQFEGWADYQPTKDGVDEKRAKDAERKRRSRAQKKDVTPASVVTDSDASAVTSCPSPPARPGPSRPVPISVPNGTEEKPRKRAASPKGTRLPQDWRPPTELVQQMRDEHPSVDIEAEHRKFVDHFIAAPGQKGVKVDWSAAWRNWIRRSVEFAPKRSQRRENTIDAWGTPTTGTQAMDFIDGEVVELRRALR